MGQANKRGTYEQRVEQAIARNEAIDKQISEMDAKSPLRQLRDKVKNKHKLAMMLIAAVIIHKVLAPSSKE